VWQLKHHAAALRSPLLLPAVQPVWDEPPADADHCFPRHHFFTWQQAVQAHLQQQAAQPRGGREHKKPQECTFQPTQHVPFVAACTVPYAACATEVVHISPAPKAWVHAEEAGKQQACKNAQQHIAPLVPAQPFPAASLEHKAAPYAQGQERPGGAPAE